jgi:dCTP deaminase
MAFLSPETIEGRFDKLIFKGGNKENIQNGAYGLCLGCESFVTGQGMSKHRMYEVKDQWVDGQQISIPPGQFALLITREEVCIPRDLMGLLSMRSKHKLKGLINVSGFHIDPGYCGKIKYSVYNAGSQPIVLTFGEPTFLIWFAEFDKPLRKEDLRQNKDGQYEITSEDVGHLIGEIASPGSLQTQITELGSRMSKYEGRIGWWKAVGYTALGSGGLLLVQYIFSHLNGK